MSDYLRIDIQPEFPACDLTVENAQAVPAVIDTRSIEARAYQLESDQTGIYSLAHHAVELFQNQKLHTSSEALRKFSEGFATYEMIDMLVTTPHVYDVEMAAARIQMFYTRHLVSGSNPNAPIESFFDECAELSNRMQMFPFIRPQLFRSLGQIAERLDTPQETRLLFAVGAQVGFELQRPSLDRL